MMFKRLIGWITGRTERLRGIERRGNRTLVAKELRKLQDLISLQGRALRQDLKILTERAEEDALGLMVYDISASDLFMLSGRHRRFVCCSNVTCFNDVCVTALFGYNQGMDVPCQDDIDRIMQWKKDCVSRITQEQVVEALDAKEGNGTGGGCFVVLTEDDRVLHGDK